MGRALQQRVERQLVHVCCVCGEARDDIEGRGTWKSVKAYANRYGLQDDDLLFSRTFCPPCYMQYQRLFGLDTGCSRSRESALGGKG